MDRAERWEHIHKQAKLYEIIGKLQQLACCPYGHGRMGYDPGEVETSQEPGIAPSVFCEECGFSVNVDA